MKPDAANLKPTSPIMQDVKPPQNSAPTPPGSGSAPIRAQIVDNIPLKSPTDQANAAPLVPVVPVPKQAPTSVTVAPKPNPKPITAESDAGDDVELDHILQDVNNEINQPEAKPQPKIKLPSPKNIVADKARIKSATKKGRSVMPVVAAAIMGAVLMFAAVYAFKQAQSTKKAEAIPGKVGTSSKSADAIQAAGGTVVAPGDLDNFSNDLQSKLNDLNDGQDFSTSSLTDQSIGL